MFMFTMGFLVEAPHDLNLLRSSESTRLSIVWNGMFDLNLFLTNLNNGMGCKFSLDVVVITELHDTVESNKELFLGYSQHNSKVVGVLEALKLAKQKV